MGGKPFSEGEQDMKKTIKRIWNLIGTLLVLAVVVLAIALAGVKLVGLEPFIVQSGSMEPDYPTGSIIYIKEVDVTTLKEWDVITFQQHYGSGVTKVEAAREKLVNADGYFDYLKTNFPNAKLYWHNTWAYQVGFSDAIATTADQKVRQDNINMLSQEVADRNGVDQIPGGQAWAIARKTVGDDLCKSDLYHDGDVGGGQYLNACIWFEVLTGKSCIGNTWRPDTYRLDEAKIVGLQQAAHQAVAEMYGADYAK